MKKGYVQSLVDKNIIFGSDFTRDEVTAYNDDTPDMDISNDRIDQIAFIQMCRNVRMIKCCMFFFVAIASVALVINIILALI